MYPQSVLVIPFSFFEPFEIKPSEKKHERCNDRQEDKDVGSISIRIPKIESHYRRQYGYDLV